MDIAALLPLINTFGVVAVLILMVLWFIKGELWPKAMVDKTLEAQCKASELSATIIGDKLKEGMESAVSAGVEKAIVRGLLEARRVNGEEKRL